MAKSKVSIMLTKLLREIGDERTEFFDKDAGLVGPDAGQRKERVLISKAEALARKIWAMALGKKTDESILETGIPDRSAASLIFDRLEGKAKPVADDPGKKKVTAAEKVSEQAKNRINNIGKK